MQKKFFFILFFSIFPLLIFSQPEITEQDEPTEQNEPIEQIEQDGQVLSALVVSNFRYSNNSIFAAEADGNSVTALLQELNFDVTQSENLSQKDFNDSIKNFSEKAKDSRVVLFYYRGYAVQSKFKNYLIPIDADILTEPDIQNYGIKIDDILTAFGKTNAEKILIFLDCSEETPWQRLISSSSGGLVFNTLPKNREILLLSSQIFNRDIFFNTSNRSLFTQCFLEEFGKPDTDVKTLCYRIVKNVKTKSDKRQLPWMTSTINTPLLLNPQTITEEDLIAQMEAQNVATVNSDIVIADAAKYINDEDYDDDDDSMFSNTEITKIRLRHLKATSIIHEYKIAFFGVPFDLYKAVYIWAKSPERGENIYRFKRFIKKDEYESMKIDSVKVNRVIKAKDSDTLDALLWVNAYNEFFGRNPVYYEIPDNVVLRNANYKSVSVAEYLNQESYRFPINGEAKNAVDLGLINKHYTGYLLAMSAGDVSEYKDPRVKCEKKVPVGLKVTASVLNPILGLGSYIEGDVSSGFLFTTTQGIGLGAGVFGYFMADKVKKSSVDTPDYLIPNIVVASGLGVYGVSAVFSCIMPFIHTPMKKQKFSFPAPFHEETEVEVNLGPELAPTGDIAMTLTFKW